MSYSINLGEWNSVFAVPCSVVDKYIKLAGSVQLKVLLWELRHAGENFTEQNISNDLCIDKADVSDAMLYWKETGLFTENDGEFISVNSTDEMQDSNSLKENKFVSSSNSDTFTSNIKDAEKAKPTEPINKHKILSRPHKPDNAFVAKRIQESTEIACLMQEAEQILGRLISNGDSATLLMIHDDFGLPADVIIMLLQYVVSIGKANTRYIEKVAMNWADEEIVTHDKAEEKLRQLDENRKAWRTVEQAVGIVHRSPTTKEQNFANIWVNEWHFDIALIHEAYERGVDNTGKFAPSYMNKILERWAKQGISTLEQAQKDKEDRIASHKSKSTKKTTYDIGLYENSDVFDSFNRR